MKDAKGHGSNNRGGKYPNIEKSGFRKGQHVGYADGAWRITGLGGGRYQAVHQQSGDMIFGDSLGHISSQLTARANETASKTSYSGDARGNLNSGLVSNAAAELHSGTPKSDAAPVHDSMRVPDDGKPGGVGPGGRGAFVRDPDPGDAGRKNTSAKYPGGRYIKDV